MRCTLSGKVALAVALGDIGFFPRDEIFLVAADPAGAVASALDVFSGSSVETDFHADGVCFSQGSPQISNLTSSEDEPDFGAALAVGHSDDNPAVEVALGTPSSGRTYVVPNLTDSGPSGPNDTVAGGTGAVAFGSGLAFADLDGDGLDELAVADPGAVVDGLESSGAVHLFRESESGFQPVATLHDSQPHAGQAFGRGLTVGRFARSDGNTDLLVVGAVDEVFTYFRSLVGGQDPRGT